MTAEENYQHYQVLRRADGSPWELGRGSMGVTYKATDTSLHCPVALKVIRADALDTERSRQRFVREARAAARLNHPNAARVFHLGEGTGTYFYAMEFIDGETLEACVRRRGPLPPATALRIALQVAGALRAASREGLVHRDIKPSNIMLLREEGDRDDELHVKVIDFGLAKLVRSGREAGEDAPPATITVAGFVGTPHYASPEQLDEKDLDVRSDIYSLGVTLWYMLGGRPPFAGSVVQVMSQHLSRKPPFAALGDLPAGVRSLLERMLEKEPERRPQSATELRRDIEQALASCGALNGAEISLDAREQAADRPLPSPSGRRRFPATSGLRHFLTLLLLVFGFVLIAGLVALSAWYVLGPDEDFAAKSKTQERHRPTPSIPQGFILVPGW